MSSGKRSGPTSPSLCQSDSACDAVTVTQPPDILCIGSILWDIIGRSPASMRLGSDVPGRITRLPGGVAMNIAMTLRRFGMTPALLTAIGRDAEGDELIAACERMGLEVAHIYRSDDLPTDRYMAVEGANGLIAAIADAHSLEAAGDKILHSLKDGRLGSNGSPWEGLIALDGNLTEALLADIATSPLFKKADLRVAPASPGKAERLLPLLSHPTATIYVNLEEANILSKTQCVSAAEASAALLERGAAAVLVTNGGKPAADGRRDQGVIEGTPPPVLVARVTGAGDTFMAAHIVAERAGKSRQAALDEALRAAAIYVSGDIGS
jgi:sugar/nucleoside kinase (ribokinase family)